MNWNLLFTGISACMAISAFVISIIVLYKTIPPVDIEISSCDLVNGEIGYFNENMQFVNVISNFNNDSFPFYIISIRVINPRNYPISIFNINILDENNNNLAYYKNMTIPYYNKINKLLAKNTKTSIGLNIPYSHYQTISASSFGHIDVVVPLSEVKLYNSKSIIVIFRSTNKSLFHTKHNKVKSDVKLKYPIHYKQFNI